MVLGLERHLWPAAEEVRCREHGWDGAALAEEAASRGDAYRCAVFLNVGNGGIGRSRLAMGLARGMPAARWL